MLACETTDVRPSPALGGNHFILLKDSFVEETGTPSTTTKQKNPIARGKAQLMGGR